MQKKKPEVQDSILSGAYQVFQQRGYHGATMSDIAKVAGTTTSNIYNYFPSKTDLIYALCGQFIDARLTSLVHETKKIRRSRGKVEHILQTLWVILPQEENGIARILIQAIASMPREADKPSEMLIQFERRIADLLRDALPKARKPMLEGTGIAHLIWMAFDGFSVNAGFETEQNLKSAVKSFTDLLLGEL